MLYGGLGGLIGSFGIGHSENNMLYEYQEWGSGIYVQHLTQKLKTNT